MASIKSLYDQHKKGALHNNYNVDVVIDYRFATTAKAEAEAQFGKLIEALDEVGLQTEVRPSDNCAVLIFVKIASDKHLKAEVYHSRVQDWLYGVRAAAPEKEITANLNEEPITEAERLRLVYLLITKPQNDGGAGITAKKGQWTCVESVYALHDHTFNQEWLKHLATKTLLDTKDLTEIKDHFGEKIAFYFSFLQSYFMALFFPAIFGFSAWILLGQYSAAYALVNGLWGIVFVEYWKKQQEDLAVQWGVRGVSKIQRKRASFKHDKEVKDPVTGEDLKIFSPFKRLSRQLLQVPFAVAAALVLGSLIATCFGIEIFISEVYNGPFKQYLTFLPTIILTIVMPTLSAMLTGFAAKLSDVENYETDDAHESAMVQKIFVLNFITSYLPIFLTAFVYVPFAQVIVPHLDIFQLTVKHFAENEKQMTAPKVGFQINPDRLKKQVIYFTVTAQIVNFALEVVVPYIKRSVFRKVKEVKAKQATKRGANAIATDEEFPEEHEFLVRVRNEAELGVYDVTSDFREMIVQFGYLALFSVIWPFTAVSFLINNWIELRGDALKIAMETQRPVPWRADSIGPWIDAISFLAWLGSLTSAALVYLFSGSSLGPDGNPSAIKGWGLLLAIFMSEHLYLIVQLAVRKALAKIDSPGLQKERSERYLIRKQFIQKISDDLTSTATASEADEKSEVSSLDSPGAVFWGRQKGQAATISAGQNYIAKSAAMESKKSQ